MRRMLFVVALSAMARAHLFKRRLINGVGNVPFVHAHRFPQGFDEQRDIQIFSAMCRGQSNSSPCVRNCFASMS